MGTDAVTFGLFHGPKADTLSHWYQDLLNCRYQFGDPSSTSQRDLIGYDLFNFSLGFELESDKLRVVGN